MSKRFVFQKFYSVKDPVSTDGDNILTIDLPYQQSTFRLRKYPAPK